MDIWFVCFAVYFFFLAIFFITSDKAVVFLLYFICLFVGRLVGQQVKTKTTEVIVTKLGGGGWMLAQKRRHPGFFPRFLQHCRAASFKGNNSWI